MITEITQFGTPLVREITIDNISCWYCERRAFSSGVIKNSVCRDCRAKRAMPTIEEELDFDTYWGKEK